jgi:hypothetical protein
MPDAAADTTRPEDLGRDGDTPPGMWSAPLLITNVNVVGDGMGKIDTDPSMTDDLLELYFSSDRAGGAGALDVWRATRTITSEPFSNLERIAEVCGTQNDAGFISHDGLTLLVTHAGSPGVELFTRPNRTTSFTSQGNEPQLSMVIAGQNYELSADQTHATATSFVMNAGLELYMFTRPNPLSAWTTPATRLTELSSAANDSAGTLDAQALTIIFHTERDSLQRHLYVATRPAVNMPFSEPMPIAELNTPTGSDPWLAPNALSIRRPAPTAHHATRIRQAARVVMIPVEASSVT